MPPPCARDAPMIRSLRVALLLAVLAVAPLATAQVHPSIDAVTPLAGPPGTRVILVGHGFVRGVAVYLGGVLLPIVRRTSTRLVVRIPEGAPSGTLLVTYGDEEERAGEFEVGAPSSRPPARVREIRQGDALAPR